MTGGVSMYSSTPEPRDAHIAHLVVARHHEER